MKLRFSLCLAVAALFSTVGMEGANAQTLQSFRRVGTLSTASLHAGAQKLFGSAAPKRAAQPLLLYRVTYRTVDMNSRPATVSGLLAIPQNGAPRGLLLWHHGTISDTQKAPSNYRVGSKTNSAEGEIALMAFASGGYAIAMPDYLGYGEHRGAHPYPMGKSNARSALDLAAPAREIARRINRPIGNRVWVSGYSQGGAVAMWTARFLQERGANLVRSAPLSGPYDLSGATLDSLLVTPKDDAQLAAQLFLVGLMGHGYAANRQSFYSEIFRPAMALAARRNFSRPQSEAETVKRLAITAKLMQARSLRDVLNPRFYEAAQRRDTSHPLIAQLRESDAFEWTPRVPMLLVALESDAIVVSENTKRALSEFRARGAGKNVVRALMLRDPNSDHGKAAVPAILAARRFFDGGFAAVPGAQ